MRDQHEGVVRLGAQLQELRTQTEKANRKKAEDIQALAELKRTLDALKQSRTDAQDSLDALRAETQSANEENAAAIGAAATAKNQRDAAEAERDEALRQAAEAQDSLDGVQSRLDEATARLAAVQTEVTSATETLDRVKGETREARDGLDRRERELERREGELQDLIASAEGRAASAALTLQEAEAEAARLRTETRAEIHKERLAWNQERQEEKDGMALKQMELDEQEADLKSERATLSALIDRRVEQATRRTREDLADARAALAESQKTSSRLREETARQATLLSAYEGRDLVALDAELVRLRDRVDTLTAERDARMAPDQTAEYRDLKKREREWRSEKSELQERLKKLEDDQSMWSIDAAEVEQLRGTAEKWEALYRQARADLDQLCERTNAGQLTNEPFPRLSLMDADERFASAPEDAIRKERKLTDVLDDIGTRLALPRPGTEDARKEGLEYDRDTLRRYLAGLAMSRWVLLEGAPGTGKTTLAVEFAHALGAGLGVISVQAGWRDRNDLVGHYNTFERQYHETDFLEHLYRAQTPRYRDLPYFIVLDEVNVSRPEYYFADFLSLLELREAGRHQPPIPLLAKPLNDDGERLPVGSGTLRYRLPSGLTEGGTRFPLPSNVWFVGTANDDESTLTPAPRTYDRAHVQHITTATDPIQAPKKQRKSLRPYSLSVLDKGFTAATQQYSEGVTAALGHFDALRAPLEKVQLGWTKRLERQVARYLPVYLATGTNAGGDVGDAVDHLLATKVLLRLRGDYNRPPSAIKTLITDLRETSESRNFRLTESLAFLAREVETRESL